jgi:hypothetical protein
MRYADDPCEICGNLTSNLGVVGSNPSERAN